MPAPFSKACKKCGRKFIAESGRGRREFCFTCKPYRGSEDNAPKNAQPAAPHISRGPGPVERAALKALTAVDRSDTVEGQIALRLARALDDPEGKATSVASTAARLIEVMDKALEGTRPPEIDALDEVTARRVAKARGAS